MNPLTNVRNITKLSERELKYNDGKTSWHDEYRGSAWIFIGGLPFDLTEGDIIAVFSQYGEPVNLNLVRDKGTGKSKGFAFLCYEDQRSTILAVDNFNGTKILGRTIRVDHVKDYKPPKDSDKLDDITRQLHITGCAPGVELPGLEPTSQNKKPRENEDLLPPQDSRRDLPQPPSPAAKYEPALTENRKSNKRKHEDREDKSKSKKSKKDKKKKSKKRKSKKHKRKERSSSSSSSSSEDSSSDEKDRSRRKRK